VPAFEELVGNHGGLGGWQREPFVLYPASFDPGPEEIVGAGHLHDLLKQWMAESRGQALEPPVEKAVGAAAASS
jgi:hypothetical protein